MKFKTKAINTFLFFSILTMLSSCNGQGSFENKGSILKAQNKAITIGDTVSQMDKSIMIIFQDKKNNYWFGSKGVYKYNGKNIIHFTKKNGLCSNGILGIQEDKSGNIYFDTEEGVSKFDGKKFSTLTKTKSYNNKWKLEPDDLWFYAGWDANGTYRYDGKSLYYLQFPKHEFEDEYNLTNPNPSYSPYGVYTIYKDNKGNIWFGTSTFGACRFDGKSLDWISEDELTEIDDGPAPGVRAIIEDKDGVFWFSNNVFNSYEVYERSAANQQKDFGYKILEGIDPSKKSGLSPSYMSIEEDKNGDIWMVTYDDGVWRYDGENIFHYPIKDGEKNINLFSIYEDNKGVLWLGTHNGGAYKFNGNTFEKFVPTNKNE